MLMAGLPDAHFQANQLRLRLVIPFGPLPAFGARAMGRGESVTRSLHDGARADLIIFPREADEEGEAVAIKTERLRLLLTAVR
jgi:hypothetical protein